MHKAIRILVFLAAFTALIPLSLSGTSFAQGTYTHQQQEWRKEQESDLKKIDGWLALTGLFWLKEGRNFLGSAPENDLIFPAAPASIGVIEFHDGTAWFTAGTSVPVTADGKLVRSIKLNADVDPPVTVLKLGTLVWNMIKRGERYGIRLRDTASPRLKEFDGMKWYPVKAHLRVTAKFNAYATPRAIPITNVLGDTYQMQSPGTLTFTLGGKSYMLEPVTEGEKLFIIFRDLTSGKTTYGAGRFLYADAPKDGKVILDFNQAVNPPCAFTPFATCPLPPARNWLKVAIPAGELKYHQTDVPAKP